jgi:hypothetical protein
MHQGFFLYGIHSSLLWSWWHTIQYLTPNPDHKGASNVSVAYKPCEEENKDHFCIQDHLPPFKVSQSFVSHMYGKCTYFSVYSNCLHTGICSVLLFATLYYCLTQTASSHHIQNIHPYNEWLYLDFEQYFLIFDSNLYLWRETFVFF